MKNNDSGFERELKAVYQKYFGFTPFSYQIKVAETLLIRNKPVILRAPTGAGKTFAAVAPYLLARERGYQFPHRLIYSLPLRTLANSLLKGMKETPELTGRFKITIQTGEQPEDRLFLGDIIFTTIDQSLSSFLKIPVSVPRSSSNINAGAIISSYLVFDEVHLLDSERAFATTWDMLEMLNGLTPFVIMTATMSDRLLMAIAKDLDAEIIDVPLNEVQEMPAQRNKERYFNLCERGISSGAILDNHFENDRTLVVCNTVKKAQEIYLEILDVLEKQMSKTKVVLIHSRFLGRHRKEKEYTILKLLGKESTVSDVIIISTQVVEVGVDISCNKLHTEICPADSLLQRIGRCARFFGEQGQVFIYLSSVKGCAPYSEDLCKRTREYMEENADKSLDWRFSLELVDVVLSDIQNETANYVMDTRRNRQNSIENVMDTGEGGAYGELIRHIDNVSVTIKDKPQEIENIYDLEAVSVSRRTFKKFLGVVNRASSKHEWQVLSVVSGDDGYKLDEVSPEDIYSPLYVINPRLVSYDSNVGLILKAGNVLANEFKELPRNQRYEEYQYREETWEQHVQCSMLAYEKIKCKELGIVAEMLSNKLWQKSHVIASIAGVATALHDVGKLTEKWQAAVNLEKRNIFLAHTKNRSRKSGIAHATPAVCIISNVLRVIVKEILGNLGCVNEDNFNLAGRSLLKAIATHHSSYVAEVPEYRLRKGAGAEVSRVLSQFGINLPAGLLIEALEKRLPLDSILYNTNNKGWEERFVYLLIVRVVRLSDRLSFEESLN